SGLARLLLKLPTEAPATASPPIRRPGASFFCPPPSTSPLVRDGAQGLFSGGRGAAGGGGAGAGPCGRATLGGARAAALSGGGGAGGAPSLVAGNPGGISPALITVVRCRPRAAGCGAGGGSSASASTMVPMPHSPSTSGVAAALMAGRGAVLAVLRVVGT